MIENSHDQDILEIAQNTGAPEEIVRKFYNEILQALSAEASINNYLNLLTKKHVHRRLIEFHHHNKSGMS